ncbi:MAG: hypothetical protein LBR46_07445, partial [Prevotella sp.]|nr:hypothetical protein [Prevotella sp.]
YFFRRTVCVSLIDNKLFDGILIRLPYVQKAGTPALHRLCFGCAASTLPCGLFYFLPHTMPDEWCVSRHCEQSEAIQ